MGKKNFIHYTFLLIFFGSLIQGNLTWGQFVNDECAIDSNCSDGYECKQLEATFDNQNPPKKCVKKEINTSSPKAECERNGKRVGTDSVGICDCNDGYKRIDNTCTPCSDPGVCCGIKLNTNVPFIGNCIEFSKGLSKTEPNDKNETSVTEYTAFPRLMGGLSRIMVSIILLVSFMGILVGGVMISASGGSDEGATKGKKIIGNVISALALLGASGVILHLINPNFFG